MNRGNNRFPVFFQKYHGKSSNPPKKCSHLFSHADDLAVRGNQTWFGSPLNYVLKINEFNYLLCASMVSDSATECAYQWQRSKPGFCFCQKKRLNWNYPPCQAVNVQKRNGERFHRSTVAKNCNLVTKSHSRHSQSARSFSFDL